MKLFLFVLPSDGSFYNIRLVYQVSSLSILEFHNEILEDLGDTVNGQNLILNDMVKSKLRIL